VVLKLDPRLGGLVEQLQGELLAALEHRHQSALHRGPEGLLLGILIRAVGERGLVQDAEVMEPLADLLGHHGTAVVGHQSPG
jgi:hypothetical protein